MKDKVGGQRKFWGHRPCLLYKRHCIWCNDKSTSKLSEHFASHQSIWGPVNKSLRWIQGKLSI